MARTLDQKLSERLKQLALIDNKPGASARLGAQLVAKAKPDRYPLFVNTSHSANPSLFSNLKYDRIKNFTPTARMGELEKAKAEFKLVCMALNFRRMFRLRYASGATSAPKRRTKRTSGASTGAQTAQARTDPNGLHQPPSGAAFKTPCRAGA